MIVKVPLERQDGSLNLETRLDVDLDIVDPDIADPEIENSDVRAMGIVMDRRRKGNITLCDILCAIIVVILLSAVMLLGIDAISKSIVID